MSERIPLDKAIEHGVRFPEKYKSKAELMQYFLNRIYWNRIRVGLNGIRLAHSDIPLREGDSFRFVRVGGHRCQVPDDEIRTCYTSGGWTMLEVDLRDLESAIRDNMFCKWRWPFGLARVFKSMRSLRWRKPANRMLDFASNLWNKVTVWWNFDKETREIFSEANMKRQGYYDSIKLDSIEVTYMTDTSQYAKEVLDELKNRESMYPEYHSRFPYSDAEPKEEE